MKMDKFLVTVSTIFTIVAVAHLVRVIMGFNLIIAGWFVPLWINTLAFLIAGALAVWGIRLKRKNK